jgi:hypothetical protein
MSQKQTVGVGLGPTPTVVAVSSLRTSRCYMWTGGQLVSRTVTVSTRPFAGTWRLVAAWANWRLIGALTSA